MKSEREFNTPLKSDSEFINLKHKNDDGTTYNSYECFIKYDNNTPVRTLSASEIKLNEYPKNPIFMIIDKNRNSKKLRIIDYNNKHIIENRFSEDSQIDIINEINKVLNGHYEISNRETLMDNIIDFVNFAGTYRFTDTYKNIYNILNSDNELIKRNFINFIIENRLFRFRTVKTSYNSIDSIPDIRTAFYDNEYYKYSYVNICNIFKSRSVATEYYFNSCIFRTDDLIHVKDIFDDKFCNIHLLMAAFIKYDYDDSKLMKHEIKICPPFFKQVGRKFLNPGESITYNLTYKTTSDDIKGQIYLKTINYKFSSDTGFKSFEIDSTPLKIILTSPTLASINIVYSNADLITINYIYFDNHTDTEKYTNNSYINKLVNISNGNSILIPEQLMTYDPGDFSNNNSNSLTDNTNLAIPINFDLITPNDDVKKYFDLDNNDYINTDSCNYILNSIEIENNKGINGNWFYNNTSVLSKNLLNLLSSYGIKFKIDGQNYNIGSTLSNTPTEKDMGYLVNNVSSNSIPVLSETTTTNKTYSHYIWPSKMLIEYSTNYATIYNSLNNIDSIFVNSYRSDRPPMGGFCYASKYKNINSLPYYIYNQNKNNIGCFYVFKNVIVLMTVNDSDKDNKFDIKFIDMNNLHTEIITVDKNEIDGNRKYDVEVYYEKDGDYLFFYHTNIESVIIFALIKVHSFTPLKVENLINNKCYYKNDFGSGNAGGDRYCYHFESRDCILKLNYVNNTDKDNEAHVYFLTTRHETNSTKADHILIMTIALKFSLGNDKNINRIWLGPIISERTIWKPSYTDLGVNTGTSRMVLLNVVEMPSDFGHRYYRYYLLFPTFQIRPYGGAFPYDDIEKWRYACTVGYAVIGKSNYKFVYAMSMDGFYQNFLDYSDSGYGYLSTDFNTDVLKFVYTSVGKFTSLNKNGNTTISSSYNVLVLAHQYRIPKSSLYLSTDDNPDYGVTQELDITLSYVNSNPSSMTVKNNKDGFNCYGSPERRSYSLNDKIFNGKISQCEVYFSGFAYQFISFMGSRIISSNQNFNIQSTDYLMNPMCTNIYDSYYQFDASTYNHDDFLSKYNKLIIIPLNSNQDFIVNDIVHKTTVSGAFDKYNNVINFSMKKENNNAPFVFQFIKRSSYNILIVGYNSDLIIRSDLMNNGNYSTSNNGNYTININSGICTITSKTNNITIKFDSNGITYDYININDIFNYLVSNNEECFANYDSTIFVNRINNAHYVCFIGDGMVGHIEGSYTTRNYNQTLTFDPDSCAICVVDKTDTNNKMILSNKEITNYCTKTFDNSTGKLNINLVPYNIKNDSLNTMINKDNSTYNQSGFVLNEQPTTGIKLNNDDIKGERILRYADD